MSSHSRGDNEFFPSVKDIYMFMSHFLVLNNPDSNMIGVGDLVLLWKYPALRNALKSFCEHCFSFTKLRSIENRPAGIQSIFGRGFKKLLSGFRFKGNL